MQAVKNIIKNSYASLMVGSGALSMWYGYRKFEEIPVLNYHLIDAKTFEDHIVHLKRVYAIVPLDAVVDHVLGNSRLSPNSLAITFDDAYAQFHHEIYPVLERHKVPATMFVPTESIDRRRLLWTNRVKAAVYGSDRTVRIGDDDISAPTRQSTFHRCVHLLNQRPVDQRDALVDELCERDQLNQDVVERHMPMSWQQIRRMHGLVDYGGHSLSHPSLSALDGQPLADEVGQCKQRLEEELGCGVKHFAYPFGQPQNVSDASIEALKASGYASGFTTTRGHCARGDSPFRLKRYVCDSIPNGRVLLTRLSGLWLFVST